MSLRRISILGVGLLGGSVALAARRAFSDVNIKGYAHRPATAQTALRLRVIDEIAPNVVDAVANSDIIILAMPILANLDGLTQFGAYLDANTIVTDVGSTKVSTVAATRQHLKHPTRFVGAHPMAGSDKRGVEHADADLFQGARCIITPVEETDPAALAAVESFWSSLGMTIVRMSPEEHDEQVARASHAVHAAACGVMMMQTIDSVAISGRGLADTTRIAGSDPELWRDILIDNRRHVAACLDDLQIVLKQLRDALDKNDEPAVLEFLRRASKARQALGRNRP